MRTSMKRSKPFDSLRAVLFRQFTGSITSSCESFIEITFLSLNQTNFANVRWFDRLYRPILLETLVLTPNIKIFKKKNSSWISLENNNNNNNNNSKKKDSF